MTGKKLGLLFRLNHSLGICMFQSVRMKFKTVREGQQAIILNHMGEGELVVGPKRVSHVLSF